MSYGSDGGANARREAEEIMIGNCVSGFKITEEEEVVIGQREHKLKGFKSDLYEKKSNYLTVNVTEWRITYICKKI